MQKTSDFSKFMVCPYGQRRLSQFGHFSDYRRRGSIFRDFVRISPKGVATQLLIEVKGQYQKDKGDGHSSKRSNVFGDVTF